MTLDILRKSGGWCVELQQPVTGRHGEVTAVEIRKPVADQVIGWRNDRYPSILAFISDLCGLPERLLRQTTSDDFDRIVFAFMNCMPSSIKDSLMESTKPLASSDEDLGDMDPVPVPDQIDPRFPATSGPVVRLTERKPQDPAAIDMAPPSVSEAVRS